MTDTHIMRAALERIAQWQTYEEVHEDMEIAEQLTVEEEAQDRVIVEIREIASAALAKLSGTQG